MKKNLHLLVVLPVFGALLLTACTSPSPNAVRPDQAKLSDNVLAIRISPQVRDIAWGAKDGSVVLVNERGDTKIIDVGPMDTGQILWSGDTVYFSGPKEEYSLTKDKLHALKRSADEEMQTRIFEDPTKKKFVSIYNVGITDGGYENLITTGDSSAIESWMVKGSFETIHQCGDRIVGITDIKETQPKVVPSAHEAGATQPEQRTEALVQLYPKPTPQQAPISTFTPAQDLNQATDHAPCVDDVAYTLATMKESGDTTQTKTPILRSWDMKSGKHQIYKLHGTNGAPTNLTENATLYDTAGSVIDGKYVWVTRTGDVYTTNLADGETQKIFTVTLTSPESIGSRFLFRKNQLLVLDVPDEETNKATTLSTYNIETGTPTTLITIPPLPGSNRDPINSVPGIIRDMAVDPSWIDKKVSQKG